MSESLPVMTRTMSNKVTFNAHDILLCINTGEKISTPALRDFADDDINVKGKRFAFPNDQFYFKTTEEMTMLFDDLPQAIDNTNEIVDKIEVLNLKRDILLPYFQVPTSFSSQDEYLEHLTWEGAKHRYKEITPEIDERIRFELFTIKTMGFAGYFLIVSDFIKRVVILAYSLVLDADLLRDQSSPIAPELPILTHQIQPAV
jgi:DNA polymerase-3 subunit alpha